MANGVIKHEYKVVLVGKTGAGKSSSGNSILGQTKKDEQAFESLNAAKPVTQKCQRKQRYLSKYQALLTVIDTPGLFDSQKPNDETVKEISKCIALSSPGPHIILLVLSCGRFKAEEVETLEILKNLFGENLHKYVIVVFTSKDDLDDDEVTIEQFMDKSPPYLKEFLEECDQRFIGICNRPEHPSHDEDVEAVIELIIKTIEENGHEYYSGELLNLVEDRIETEIQTILETDQTKTMNEILEDLKNEIESMDVDSQLEGLWGDITMLTTDRIHEAFRLYIENLDDSYDS